MNTVLTVQGSSVAVENKKSILSRIFNKKNVLKAAKGILPLAVLAAVFPEAAMATTTGTDLMKSGDGTVNPLKTVPFMQTLYFIDGDDPDQVAWMKRQVPETLISKIILVKGSIPDTSAALDSRIYFDQNGVLSQRFGLTSVPARITPAPSGERLNIEYFPPTR